MNLKPMVLAALCFTLTATATYGEIIRFDDPADLNRFEVIVGNAASMEVADGVLIVTAESAFRFMLAVKDVRTRNGVVSCRVRYLPPVKIANAPPAVRPIEPYVGVFYRGQSGANVEGFAGYLTYLDFEDNYVSGSLVNAWIEEVFPNGQGGRWALDIVSGAAGVVPDWDGEPSESWIELRAEYKGGTHTVYVGKREPLQPAVFIRTEGIRRTITSNWPDYPVRELPPEPYDEGMVGLFLALSGQGVGRLTVEIDDFRVTEALGVEPHGKTATTWANSRRRADVSPYRHLDICRNRCDNLRVVESSMTLI
ncbi:MAG: hypothetical protein O3A46_03690 [Candidatus Poribacteria bacterium]|nr:hypothetical protein [Candidatus Poribacteria bacterium]